MNISHAKSEIALVLIVIGAIGVYTTGMGLILVLLGLILGLLGIPKAPSRKKRNLGIVAVVGSLLFFAFIFYSLMGLA